MKRIGPELKLPKLPKLGASQRKAPTWLADVYYDLRERRLLPLVALVLVAIFAVPFLLGGSEEPVPPPTAVESAEEAVDLDAAAGRTLTVVEAKPGLRDYRKRLRGRTPHDPFRQKYTSIPATSQLQSTSAVSSAPVAGEEDTTEVSVTEEEGSVTVEVDDPGPTDSGGSTGGGDPKGGGGSTGPRDRPAADTDGIEFFAYRPDVRFGVAGSEPLKEYSNLPLTSLLPKKDPVVIFLGVTEDGSRAVLDVSSEVVIVKGEGRCIGGRQSCGLLFMRAGDAVTLLTEMPGRSFRLAIDAIEFVKVDPTSSAQGSAAGEPGPPGFSQNFSK